MIYQCKLVEWYKFNDQCCIKTCKYWSGVTPTHCLAIDHKFPSGDRTISESELLLYKFRPEDNMDTRSISSFRKRGPADITNTLIAYHFIEYIAEEYGSKRTKLVGKNRRFERLFEQTNLRFRRIGYKHWMLPYLIDQKIWNEFKQKRNIDPEVGQAEAFLLKPKEFEDFVALAHQITSSWVHKKKLKKRKSR